ncbi:hypothetical protein DB313_05045 (plasmid) [Borrelia turcica IST7]|uniref:Uncharacterized protein n=1 Tax=Borrelia turcica IST7 TaxID=1104446 RepID=A0A386PMU6_9SPIR|nr:hypothetical protein [Borrelia turcica]AYE36866.1 hypothetical protein DB313_05045 [Borrelia turcica IST7]
MYKACFKFKTNNKLVFKITSTTLLIAFICCNVYDDDRMQEDYKEIKEEILQKHSKEPINIDSHTKPTGLSPELKQKLFDVGMHTLELDATIDKLIEKIKPHTVSYNNNFKTDFTQAGEFPALLNKLRGDFKEEFIHGNFKLEKIKLEAEEAIKDILPTGGKLFQESGLKQEKERFITELKEAYDDYFIFLTLCMYVEYHADNKVVGERLIDFFKGTPDKNGDSIDSVLKEIEAIKNRAVHFKACMSKSNSSGEEIQKVQKCSSEAEQKYPYPRRQQARSNS